MPITIKEVDLTLILLVFNDKVRLKIDTGGNVYNKLKGISARMEKI